MKYIITGGNKLKGEINISGNKNSILPCMAAALLTNEEVVLENVPDIVDVDVMCDILMGLGVSISRDNGQLILKTDSVNSTELPQELVKRLRASVVLLGPLLARAGEVTSHFPGGDVIGIRSINIHLEGFRAMGAEVEQNDLEFKLSYRNKKRPSGDLSIFLEEASCTAVENLLLAAVLGEGNLEIRNCPKEPQIIDVCNMLTSMGAKISGIGTDTLSIKGVDKLSGTKFRISDDYIEACTYAIAAAITGGKIKINCSKDLDLEPINVILSKFGVIIESQKGGFIVEGGELRGVKKVVTNIWPGFPTDLMSAVIVLATRSKGVTLCHDWMYESRMFFVDKLITMGANITIADPHRVVIYGPSELSGRELDTPDIRAGMALVLAALVSEGQSVIDKAELIERGYEDVVSKLKNLGANISRSN